MARAAVLDSDSEAATGFVLGDEARGGGRGEAAAGTEEDAAAWHSLPNGGDSGFELLLLEPRWGGASGRGERGGGDVHRCWGQGGVTRGDLRGRTGE
jgi:hypothetical protein